MQSPLQGYEYHLSLALAGMAYMTLLASFLGLPVV
jgi:hypothetical protein